MLNSENLFLFLFYWRRGQILVLAKNCTQDYLFYNVA